MATILNFRRNDQRKSKPLPSGHTADIVFFTGVRYERPVAVKRVIRKTSSARLAVPS